MTRLTIKDLDSHEEGFVQIDIEEYRRRFPYLKIKWHLIDSCQTYIDRDGDSFINGLIEAYESDTPDFTVVNNSTIPLWRITNKPFFAKVFHSDKNKTCSCLELYGMSYRNCKCTYMMCSRKVGLGDVVYHDNAANQPMVVVPSTTEPPSDATRMITKAGLTPEFYKILGEISSDAEWVKDGDKFSLMEMCEVKTKEQNKFYKIRGKDRRFH